MKKNVSLFNNSNPEKKQIKNLSQNSYLKPAFFAKFTIETLFYIFYYMARDSLQICAAEELYKRKWRYHTEYSVWFIQDDSEKNNEVYNYFNYNEWKVTKYVFSPISTKMFLSENEVMKYFKALNIDK
jgi:CCR4-NOT transcriptional regulation complex NOT5 subunit